MNIFTKIRNAAGVSSELWLISHADPNAFAMARDGKNHVGITLPMIDVIGWKDDDIYAALFGHELAHLVKEHGSQSATRRGILTGIGLLATLIIAAKTGRNVGGLADLTTNIVDTSYSRDQEREADASGLEYMVSAGFDPEGMVRLDRLLLATAKIRPLPFLATHPSPEERIESARTAIAALRPPAVAVVKGPSAIGMQQSDAAFDWKSPVSRAIDIAMNNSLDPIDEALLTLGCREGLMEALQAYPGASISSDRVVSIAAYSEISRMFEEISRQRSEAMKGKRSIDHVLPRPGRTA